MKTWCVLKDALFQQVDSFGVKSARRWQSRHALQRLTGTVRYPAQATPRRSSLSRVPENGTHGLKGEYRNGLA